MMSFSKLTSWKLSHHNSHKSMKLYGTSLTTELLGKRVTGFIFFFPKAASKNHLV